MYTKYDIYFDASYPMFNLLIAELIKTKKCKEQYIIFHQAITRVNQKMKHLLNIYKVVSLCFIATPENNETSYKSAKMRNIYTL